MSGKTVVKKLPAITVHGRFQPPLHVNHWDYVRRGFERAEHVTFLITNPYLNEQFEASASWRNDPENNPFSYEERTQMFKEFLTLMNIPVSRYEFKPFNIKEDSAFLELDKNVPNLVNVYSEWSAKKVQAFKNHGLEVIQLNQPKTKPVSGTIVRELINSKDISTLADDLIQVGYMPEAVPGLLKILAERK
jgi:nicotinamide mononucleotide adenylyltransferase